MACEHKWIEDYNPRTGTQYRCKFCGATKGAAFLLYTTAVYSNWIA